MKIYTILKNNKIIELSKANLKDLKPSLSGQEALDLAEKHGLRLPFQFEVINEIDSNKKLKQILIDNWIWTGEKYKNSLSGLCLCGNLDLDSYWYYLDDSYSVGRVVFVKDKIKLPSNNLKSDLKKLEKIKKILRGD